MAGGISLVTILVLPILLLWVFQRRLMYLPFADVPPPAAMALARTEEVRFQTEDGLVLNGWFVQASNGSPAATFLVFNGNAGNRAFRAPLAARLSSEGFSVLLFDYRGFGENPGRPNEDGLARDARAARAYLDSRSDVAADRLVYFGESLGSGVAIALAIERAPAALILRSPFTSMVDVARYHYPWLPVRQMLWDRFPSLERIDYVTCPVLVVAGSQDRIIPPEQSRRVYEAAREPKRMVLLPADHNDDDLLAGDRMIGEIRGFLEGIDTQPVRQK